MSSEIDWGDIQYQVDLGSVLDCQIDDLDRRPVFSDFAEAKEYAVEAFEVVIDRLTDLCKQIREATSYSELDLGWWEPLFEQIDHGEKRDDDDD
jgi:hypothetical protein